MSGVVALEGDRLAAAHTCPRTETPTVEKNVSARTARRSRTRKHTTDAEERQWLPRHASGDGTAFRALMHHYSPAVMGYIVRCGVPAALRDDLFQDVFFKIHRNARLYSPRHPLRPWLFTVTANVVRSHFRKQGVWQRVFSKREPHSDPADSVPTNEQGFEAREIALTLDRAIQRLPMKQREVLSLICIEDMAIDEVSVALSMPLNTVKTNLQRARRALRKELGRFEKTVLREVSR